jgi:Flp pilus assembly pilin Flp
MWIRRATAKLTMLAAQDAGQDLMEYGLLVSLIATFLVGALNVVGDEVSSIWTVIAAIQYTQP